VISIPADVSCDTVNADNVGYTWVKEGNAVERKSETVVNMQRFIKNIETSKVKGYFWAGGLGFPWHPVEAPTQEQTVKEFSKGSKVSPSKILCRTVPPKKGRVSDSGGCRTKPHYTGFLMENGM